MPILEDACTQYNDMTGTAAIDWHDGGMYHDFAQHCGVDTDAYFPLALTIGQGVDIKSGEHFLNLTIYAADKSVVGSSFEDINAYAREHGSAVPTKRFDGRASLKDFAAYAKRFEVVLRPTKSPDIETIEYESDV